MPSAQGTLRARLTRVLAGTLGATVIIAGGALLAAQSRTLERQLDASLRAHARSEIETAIDRSDHRAHLHDDAVNVSHAAGRTLALTKYAALYGRDGAVLTATSSLRGHAPPWRRAWLDATFDVTVRGVPLRAVVLPMGTETDARALLLAVEDGQWWLEAAYD